VSFEKGDKALLRGEEVEVLSAVGEYARTLHFVKGGPVYNTVPVAFLSPVKKEEAPRKNRD
jgi:hypothetical protein